MHDPVFLLGSHKSGTSLLRSLFDGAEQLFVVPIETHFFQYCGYWIDYALCRSLPKPLDFDQFVSRLMQHLQQSHTSDSRTSDSMLKGRWSIDRFRKYLESHGLDAFVAGDHRRLLECYIGAVHVSLYGYPPSTGRFLEKSVEHAEFAVLLRTLYPDAKFIHLVRNPYATLVAVRKHFSKRSYPYLGSILEALENSYYFLYRNQQEITNYNVVRYEDLVSKPEETMRALARFVDVPFKEVLLMPTSMGEPWKGNSTSGLKFNGISTAPLASWKTSLNDLEKALVNLLFHHVLRDFGYPSLESERSPYWPVRGETPAVFIANRWLWRTASLSRSH